MSDHDKIIAKLRKSQREDVRPMTVAWAGPEEWQSELIEIVVSMSDHSSTTITMNIFELITLRDMITKFVDVETV